MAEAVDVDGFMGLVTHLRHQYELVRFIPRAEMPTLDNVTVERYVHDDRNGWDTHIVCVNAKAWGFTDGPLQSEIYVRRVFTKEHWFACPLKLRQRYWKETNYNFLPPSPELVAEMDKYQ